jgi:hypothetical protein
MEADLTEIREQMEARSTDELVSILRNRDEDEWLPPVFDIVASILSARGVRPEGVVALGPEGDPGTDVVESQPLVTIGRFLSTLEANAGRMALEQAGLAAWVTDEAGGGIMPGFGVGARLQVRVDDEKAARAVLASGPATATELPPELAESPCPKCGSTQVTQAAVVVSRGEGRDWRYECMACRHTWSDPVS